MVLPPNNQTIRGSSGVGGGPLFEKSEDVYEGAEGVQKKEGFCSEGEGRRLEKENVFHLRKRYHGEKGVKLSVKWWKNWDHSPLIFGRERGYWGRRPLLPLGQGKGGGLWPLWGPVGDEKTSFLR